MNYSERHSRIVKHWFIIAVLGYTIPHTSAATAGVIEDFGSEVFQHSSYRPFQILHHLTSRCLQLSRNISKKFISHVMMNCKLPWEYGFENSLKISTVTGLNNFFSTSSVVWGAR
jgi:hypothetical protein